MILIYIFNVGLGLGYYTNIFFQNQKYVVHCIKFLFMNKVFKTLILPKVGW